MTTPGVKPPAKILVTTESEIKSHEFSTYFDSVSDITELRTDIGAVVNSCELSFSRKMVFTDQGYGIMIGLAKSGKDIDPSFGIKG